MTEKILSLEKITIEPKSKATASIIWLHGLGADGNDFVDIVPKLNLPEHLNVRFVFPHAPIRPITINRFIPMRAWYDVYSLSDLRREDALNIAHSQTAIEALIQDELNTGISSQEIILAGFSQGGAMALYTGLRYHQPLAGIIVLSAYLPLANRITTEAHSKNKKTPIFMGHGYFDDILPIHLSESSRDQLLTLNYSVEWHGYAMGHQVCDQEIKDVATWLGT